MCRRALVAVVVVGLGFACDLRDEKPHFAEPPAALDAAIGVVPSTEISRCTDCDTDARPPDAGAGTVAAAEDPKTEERVLLDHLAQARIVRARPISRRSLSLKLALRDGPNAVFKPLRRDDRTARYEVAAFRLSRILGLGGVPPSIMRRIPLDNFEWLLGREHADVEQALRDHAHRDERSRVWGATIIWLDGLTPSGFEGAAGRARLERLLAIDGPSLDQAPLAAEVSTMVVFDYVIGNWDRFSGGNLFLKSAGDQLALIDNNGAFSSLSETQQLRLDKLLGVVFRFSSGLVQNLRDLSRESLEATIARDSDSAGRRRLLTRREIAKILERRDVVIARVNRLISEHGSARILTFR